MEQRDLGEGEHRARSNQRAVLKQDPQDYDRLARQETHRMPWCDLVDLRSELVLNVAVEAQRLNRQPALSEEVVQRRGAAIGLLAAHELALRSEGVRDL